MPGPAGCIVGRNSSPDGRISSTFLQIEHFPRLPMCSAEARIRFLQIGQVTVMVAAMVQFPKRSWAHRGATVAGASPWSPLFCTPRPGPDYGGPPVFRPISLLGLDHAAEADEVIDVP